MRFTDPDLDRDPSDFRSSDSFGLADRTGVRDLESFFGDWDADFFREPEREADPDLDFDFDLEALSFVSDGADFDRDFEGESEPSLVSFASFAGDREREAFLGEAERAGDFSFSGEAESIDSSSFFGDSERDFEVFLGDGDREPASVISTSLRLRRVETGMVQLILPKALTTNKPNNAEQM